MTDQRQERRAERDKMHGENAEAGENVQADKSADAESKRDDEGESALLRCAF